MKRSAKYVGLDVHQATTVVAVREESGRVIARSILPTETTALVEFFRGLRGPVSVALEEGTQAQWIHDLLAPVVQRIVVCDRRGDSAQRPKGDQRDADALAEGVRVGRLRAVYHGTGSVRRATLRELGASYQQVVEDTTRVMVRLKALFRARGIKTPGKRIYSLAPPRRAEWLERLVEPGARLRAEVLYEELAVLQLLRRKLKRALLGEAKADPAWRRLRTIPFLGPIRVALLFATLQTPWRFRTKRQLWAYAGLAVVTRTTAEYEWQGAHAVRRRRAPLTRGLNRNHHRVVKAIFKGAALAASTHGGALQGWYQELLARGMRVELARVTLARKLAAITLRLWKTGDSYDATQLTVHSQ